MPDGQNQDVLAHQFITDFIVADQVPTNVLGQVLGEGLSNQACWQQCFRRSNERFNGLGGGPQVNRS